MKRKERTWYGLILTITLMLGVLSASVAVPLVCRPFYYAHVKLMHMEEKTPWTEAEIREAYDEMMDFCMKGEEFGTGVLKWSEDGKAHFADCAVLFRLDLAVAMASAAVLCILAVLFLLGFRPKKLFRRGPFFWAGLLEILTFLSLAGYAATDFDRFFVQFHHVFFPGKENWIFYYDVDEIINVLPETFFMDCGILVVAVLFLLCLAEILIDRKIRKRKK